MKKDLEKQSSDSEEENEEEDDDYSDIDSDRPNLLQINKKIDKMNRKKENELLEKKRKRNKDKTDIIYDANKKEIVDSFIPNLEELNDFLKNCKIEEINLEEIEKIPNDKIFDPDLFVKANYGKKEKEKNELKNNFSIEELGFILDNKNNKEEEIKEIFEPKDKFSEKKVLNKILLEKDLNKQKNQIHELIEKIKKMNIEEIKKIQNSNANTKLNIVLDLDNTLIFGSTVSKEEAEKLINKNKRIKIIRFEHNKNIILSALIIRKGLQEFFDYTKNFCNFYINTLGYENYGLQIKNVLEKIFNIKFTGFKGRKNDNEKTKLLSNLFLEEKNAVIFDDKPHVWRKDNENVIISKIFTDRERNLEKLDKVNLQNNTTSFLEDYSPFSYFKSSNENWLKQRLKLENLCPFYDFKKRNCFSGEYLESTQYQFVYMKEVIKILYYLIYNSNMRVPEALKVIRYNIFFNSCFDLCFYKRKGLEILKDIIINCGGIIYDKNKKNEYKGMKFYFVCFIDDYNIYKDEIKKEKIGKENPKVLSDKYIINSFYFMTNLESELGNPQYCLDVNDEDNFDNY